MLGLVYHSLDSASMVDAQPNRIIAKNVKICTYSNYVRCATLIVPAELGLRDKGRAIKGLVVCNVVWIGYMIYGMSLWTSAKNLSTHYLTFEAFRMEVLALYADSFCCCFSLN